MADKQLHDISVRVYNVKNYGAVADGTTDDTAAIQSAINAAHTAGGGVVYFPMGIYAISGALQTSVNSTNPNSQLYIPLSQAGTSMIRIKLLGEAPPQWATEVISGQARNLKGVILKSTITGSGTRPAVIGTPWYSSTYGTFNYTYCDMENIVVRTRTMTGATQITPSMSGVNFENIVAATFKNVKVDVESQASEVLSPAGTGTVGIYMPKNNNKAVSRFNDIVFIEGYEKGAVISEHFRADELLTAACYYGLVFDPGTHLCSIGHYKAEGNKHNILINGELPVTIHAWDTEHYTGAEWFSFTNDIQVSSGNSRLSIFHMRVVNSGGATGTFTTSFTNYKIFNGDGQNVTL